MISFVVKDVEKVLRVYKFIWNFMLYFMLNYKV